MHKWSWTEGEPWPPVEYVRSAPLLDLPEYGPLRAKLGTVVPSPTNTYSDAGFATVDTVN
jgi:hypothetical protein